MSDYTCPNCRGEFPKSSMNANPADAEFRCPWCGTPMDGEYEHEPVIHSLARQNREEERKDKTGPLSSRLMELFR